MVVAVLKAEDSRGPEVKFRGNPGDAQNDRLWNREGARFRNRVRPMRLQHVRSTSNSDRIGGQADALCQARHHKQLLNAVIAGASGLRQPD